jgi:hypothetical protein
MKIRYKLQTMQWQLHLLRTGGAACGYSPIEALEFLSGDEARAALSAYEQKYANPPQSFVQFLAIETPDNAAPFQERARVLYETRGPRNGPENCTIRRPEWR